MFKNPFSFNGRIRRKEYALSLLIICLGLPLFIIFLEQFLYGKLLILVFIPFIWLHLAQSAKRCHDRGNSGWFQIIPFYYIFLLFGAGDLGRNKYGENPKEFSKN